MGTTFNMLLSVALVLAAWIVLSLPVALVVGRMFAAAHAHPAGRGQAAASEADRVAHLSRVEARRTAAARWSHEARVLSASRRRVGSRPQVSLG